jgi:hypothetical protein
MSGRAGGGSGEGGGEGQMSADEALAWQLQDKLFLQVFFFAHFFLLCKCGWRRGAE